jgi:hypothetical protein
MVNWVDTAGSMLQHGNLSVTDREWHNRKNESTNDNVVLEMSMILFHCTEWRIVQARLVPSQTPLH